MQSNWINVLWINWWIHYLFQYLAAYSLLDQTKIKNDYQVLNIYSR